MLPFNPRELRRMLRRMGIRVEEFNNVRSVSIVLDDKEIIIRQPQVSVMTVQGQKIYQIVGGQEESVDLSAESGIVEEVTFSDDDIKFVMEQAGVDRELAVRALKEAGGDIAKAILLITEGKLKS
ncbi:MAG: nascent polypeptide-associated complex protein [Desulfurococcales archaeon]|nr:nascent polypeptide-associated complex protein [Desulfurococcales archaeon]